MIFSIDDVIVGSLLGDACIKQPSIARRSVCKANCWFSKSQCARYEEYLQWHETNIPFFNSISSYRYNSAYVEDGMVKTDPSKKRDGFILDSSANAYYTALRDKWYPNGKKIVPLDISLTLPMLAIWYCDDGYNVQGHKRAGICSQSFTIDECVFLAEQIDRITGISCHVVPNRQIMIYSKQYFAFMETISPWIIWECMKYKCDVTGVMPLAYKKGEKHPNAKLTWPIVESIRDRHSKGDPKKVLAQQYSVSRRTISNIVNDRTWLAETAAKMESIL